ncbi:translocation/assembly module TamB domain-containing protein [Crocosphaera sp. XPORK-15E]|uniref:translocation/assembly module TamB domain-containing protein n=1 Tax=Crocosphaera sp. XPORK-15E TaxID=3110247 RepID=UPI002B216A7F|nr:translocation/assembly module TamB domain-containing protein [Crocosphaera sp. XPORK-15E]MEA5533852.1 translocation/assembly module TamB domain-containing protein [Crocosphaera sp. XPORK-15E]
MSQSPTPQDSLSRRLNRLLRLVRQPKTIAVGTTSFALILLAYGGLRLFLREYLPPWLEEQVSQVINRPVEIGELKGFSLTSLHLDMASIPATSQQKNKLIAKTVIIKFNPLAVLFEGTLPITISPEDVQVEIRQKSQDEWLTVEVNDELIPLDLDLTFDIKNTDIALFPQNAKNPVKVKLKGKATYQEKGEKQWKYAINLGFFDTDEITLKGRTLIATTQSEIELTLNKLALPAVMSLLPNFPVEVVGGDLQANLNLNVPSIENLRETQGKGNLALGEFRGQVKALKEPIKALANISFNKDKILIDKAQISLGKILTNIQGYYDWKTGSNINIAVRNLSVSNIRQVVPFSFPFKLKGEFEANLNLTGMLQDPLLKGKIVNNKIIEVAQTPIKKIAAEFQVNFDDFLLQNLQIETQGGGEIKAQGKLKQNLTKLIKEKKQINFKTLLFELNFQTKLPSQTLINAYYKLPNQLNLDLLKAEGTVKGTLENLNGLIKWQTSGNLKQLNTEVVGQGNIFIKQNNLLLNNTVIKTKKGTINVTGRGNLKNTQWQVSLLTEKLELNSFAAIFCQNQPFQCPQNIILNNGNIRLAGNFNQPILQSLKIDSNLLLSIDQGKISINSQIQQGNFITSLTTLQLPINSFLPQLTIPVTLNNAQINLLGDLTTIWQNSTLNLNALKGNGNVLLNIGNSRITARGNLQGESLEGVANINNLSVNQVFSQLPIPVNIVKSEIDLKTNLRSLLFSGTKPNFNTVQIRANTELLIDNQTIIANSQLNQGIIKINATTTPFITTPLIFESYPSIKVKKAQTNLTASLSSVLSFDLSSLEGYTEAELEIAEGTVTLSNKFNNNQITSNIKAKNINLSSLNSELFSSSISERLNAEIKTSIALNLIFSSETLLPIKVESASLNLGDKNLQANGSLLVSDLWTVPDIKNLLFNVDTKFDLNIFPLDKILAKIPINRKLLPTKFQLEGVGEFNGKLAGNNILTAPFSPGNLQLNGDLKLSALSFNELIFEPILQGKVEIDLSKKISINLQGKQDVISAFFEPCLQEKCLFPYSIQSFKIRQDYNNEFPIIAQGNRQDNNLIARLENLPIERLRIMPLGDYGLPNYLGGNLNFDLTFNPSKSKAIGKITIIDPRFGKIVGGKLQANVIYQDHKFILEETIFNIGESSYNIAGSFDIKSKEIIGKANINDGYIQDILTALQISNWDSLLRLLQLKKPNFTTAGKISTNPLGDAESPLDQQLNQFWNNDRKVRQIFAESQAGDLPRELDFRGKYQAKLNLSGTLQDPKISLQFEGDKWQWTPQPSTASIVRSLGLVMESFQVIPIEKLAIQGELSDGLIQINPSIKVGQALVNASLNLAYQDTKFSLDSSEFKIQNLTLDFVRNLIVIPSDVNGIINLEGTINGTLAKPKIDGQFEFNDGAINARLLNQNLRGKFAYTDDQLRVNTTYPDFIKITANIPFPIIENRDNYFDIKANLGQQTFALLQPLTLDQIIWVEGNGSINADLNGKIYVDNQIKISLDNDSKISVNLDQTKFTNNLLPTVVTLNGQINLQNGNINVEDLTANFAKNQINARGIFPLFPPNSNNPITNPLTINITQNEINQSGIYQGLINGEILITGALISPIIGGEVRFSQGKLMVPDINLKSENQPEIFVNWLGTLASNNNLVIPPQLNNFKISLEEIAVQKINKRPNIFSETPNVFLNLSGDLALNGQINSLSIAELLSLEPSGQIRINGGQVNIPITRVFVSRQHENTLTFFPNQGLLNPSIDLELKLYLFLVGLQSIKDNEITDDIVQSGRAKSAEVTLTIRGSASEVLPTLGQKLEQVCQLRSANSPPIPASSEISPEKLRQLARCIEVNNLGTNSIQDLLRSPIVSFSSNPPLSNSELLTLFGTKKYDIAEQLQGQNSTQLLEAGVLQSAVVVLPFLQDWVFESNEATTEFGKKLGLTNLRLYPVLETVYDLPENALIRFSYDYGLNEATIRYETKF